MQRALIVIGLALAGIGLAWPWISKLGLGRLPGDIRIETENGAGSGNLSLLQESVPCQSKSWLGPKKARGFLQPALLYHIL